LWSTSCKCKHLRAADFLTLSQLAYGCSTAWLFAFILSSVYSIIKLQKVFTINIFHINIIFSYFSYRWHCYLSMQMFCVQLMAVRVQHTEQLQRLLEVVFWLLTTCILVHLLILLGFIILAVFFVFLSYGKSVCLLNVEPAVKTGRRPPSTASTSSSEISVADDNVSRDLVHNVQTKVSKTCCLLKYWVYGLWLTVWPFYFWLYCNNYSELNTVNHVRNQCATVQWTYSYLLAADKNLQVLSLCAVSWRTLNLVIEINRQS